MVEFITTYEALSHFGFHLLFDLLVFVIHWI